MSKIFPTVPRIVMCYLEPISLLLGTLGPITSPEFFIPSQLPTTHLVASQTTPTGEFNVLPTERVLAYQCANLYALLMMVGLGVLNTTTEPAVVHAYVWALGIADVGHFAATGYVMGLEGVTNWRQWNATMWGNLGAVIVLFAVRSGYLVGVFGKDRIPEREWERKKVKEG